VDPEVGDELDARLEALANRIDVSQGRVSAWVEPATRLAASAPPPSGEVDELRGKLRAAESSGSLQAQRCSVLEDRVAELEAALVGARDQRARAEARAETARAEADRALDQLETHLSERSGPSPAQDPNFNEAIQARLLEIDRLTNERDALRRSSDEWRSKARTLRRERDDSTLALARTESQLQELRERDTTTRRRLEELEKQVGDQKKQLEVAERRTKHLREHIGAAR
jgi:chromosome segregation ATPase